MKSKFLSKNADKVSLILGLVYLASILSSSFFFLMKNRVSSMEDVALFAIESPAKYALIFFSIFMIIGAAFTGKSSKRNIAYALLVVFNFALAFYVFGIGASEFTNYGENSIRISFGLGFYTGILCLCGIMARTFLRLDGALEKSIIMSVAFVLLLLLLMGGYLDNTSIMIEYNARSEKVNRAFWSHLGISLQVIFTSVVLGIPLGVICYKNKYANAIIMGILNIARSIPSIALIMIMVPILSVLKDLPVIKIFNIRPFSVQPLFLALLFYALFQIVISMTSSLSTIPKDYIKVARGMGMRPKHIITKVQLPLIFPVLMSGMRLAIIGTYTGVSLGTYVGFGGLGTFVVMGGGGAIALDLILLGAIPVMAMIFVTNFIFTQAENAYYAANGIKAKIVYQKIGV